MGLVSEDHSHRSPSHPFSLPPERDSKTEAHPLSFQRKRWDARANRAGNSCWTLGGSLALLPAHHPTSLRGGWHRLHSPESHCRVQALLPSGDRCPLDSASPLSAEEEQDSSQFNHSLLDAVGCACVPNSTSHFPCCLSSQIYLLPDVAYLAESAAHAGARFSYGFVAKS